MSLTILGGLTATAVVPQTIIPTTIVGIPARPGTLTILPAASQALSALRAVRFTSAVTVDYVDPTDLAQGHQAVGITMHAAVAGANVTVLTAGEMQDTSWNWTPGPVFIGAYGSLTQLPPSAPLKWSRVVAIAETPTVLWVAPQPPIFI